jgi:YD repeat-containing protein
MTTTRQYDFLNRLTQISSAPSGSPTTSSTYGYNLASQRTALTNADSCRWAYTYDALGQASSGKKSWPDGTPVAGQQFEYGFDDIGNQKSASAGRDQNPRSSVAQSFTSGTDLSGNQQGAGGVGGLLAVNVIANGTNFVAFDGNGNVSGLVNAADGTFSAQYEYGPFGEVLRQTGPMAKANPFRFSTKYQDDETHLLCYGRIGPLAFAEGGRSFGLGTGLGLRL